MNFWATSCGEAARAFGNVSVTPTTYLLERRGRLLATYVGELEWREFHARIERRRNSARGLRSTSLAMTKEATMTQEQAARAILGVTALAWSIPLVQAAEARLSASSGTAVEDLAQAEEHGDPLRVK